MLKKSMCLILFFFVTVSAFLPIEEVKAKKINDVTQIGYKLGNVSKCGGKTGILGDVTDEQSVAWLVQKILNYIKILGPTIAIVLSGIDFAKVIVTSDADSMKKAQSKFIKRMIAAVLLFFVPLLTQVLLGLFGFTSDVATCGLS